MTQALVRFFTTTTLTQLLAMRTGINFLGGTESTFQVDGQSFRDGANSLLREHDWCLRVFQANYLLNSSTGIVLSIYSSITTNRIDLANILKM